MNSRPSFLRNNRKKICLICEGFEEFDYVSRLLELGVWSEAYDFTLVNAESNGNISARYQDSYQSDSYDLVLALCDTDRKPHKDFELICEKINRIFGNDTAATEVLIFANPCSMQIELLHFTEIRLRTQNKHKNAAEIERLIGIRNYKASKEQRARICKLITKDNYMEMKVRLQKLSPNYSEIPSSNLLVFLQRFESSDASWIDEINKKLEG